MADTGTEDVDRYIDRRAKEKHGKPPVTEKKHRADPIFDQLEEEWKGFAASGQAFIKEKPDFQERLNAAAARGLTLNNKAQRAIMRMAGPEVLYYLAAPENEQEARNVMALSGPLQELEIRKIADRLTSRRGSRSALPENYAKALPRDRMDPDDYIRMRQEEKLSLRKLRGHR